MIEDLTKREFEVLDLVAHGYTRYEISEKFAISKQTTAAHLHAIYQKIFLEKEKAKTSYLLTKAALMYLKYIGELQEDWEIKI